jgi:hypothetical protein
MTLNVAMPALVLGLIAGVAIFTIVVYLRRRKGL